MGTDEMANKENNTYVIDIEDSAEAARLIDQDNLFTRAMGGIFPEQRDDFFASQILDLACGPGGWTTEVAFHYPDAKIMGVDINPRIIQYAQALARVQHLDHASFSVMDIKKPLPFEDGSFDLINGRLLVGFMDRQSWSQLLLECKRVLKPGGILRLNEIDISVTNSAAMQQMNTWLYQALAAQERTFSIDGRSLGIAYILGRLLRIAGFKDIEKRSFHIDGSYGSSMYPGMRRDTELFFPLIQPFLLSVMHINGEAYDEVYQQVLFDICQEDYSCIHYGLTVWGKKA